MAPIRRLASALLIAGFWLGAAGTAAAAGNPNRQLLPPPGDYPTDTCGPAIGTVVAHVTFDKQFTKTFVEQDGTLRITVNGPEFGTVTRLSNGNSVALNFSGNGWFLATPGGELIIGQSHGRLIDIAPPGGGIWLYSGNVTFDPTNGAVITSTGSVTNICSLLS
jgi:hypothetical protein